MTPALPLPLAVEVAVAALALTGAFATLVGSFGLLRLPGFFQRIHAPTLGATLGTWSLALATAMQFSFLRSEPFAHPLLIAAFIALTAPVTTIFLMRAGLFRRRLAEREGRADDDA
ncbi:MAG TPA: monovalent cation/H(+) antiporter subunit G [Anaeromyxobacteraceae bacterium]|nr:monovalent cation/H(+) antiporter subunit G [Anaeromyxobacteraceae bacterium]